MTESAAIAEKYAELVSRFRSYVSVLVTFSGGVDSTLLLAAAIEALGVDQVIAVTALSPTFPAYEAAAARAITQDLGVRHLEVATRELDLPEVLANGPERCYYCKRERLSACRALAAELGIAVIVDGTNLDDAPEERPGMRALAEFGVHSPLRDVGLHKEEIRLLSRRLGLPTAEKPSLACLATRIPTGTPLSLSRLARIEACETVLHTLELRAYRARDHGDLVRIEVAPEDLGRFADPVLRQTVVAAGLAAGFTYVALDLQGYRTGNMTPRPEKSPEPFKQETS